MHGASAAAPQKSRLETREIDCQTARAVRDALDQNLSQITTLTDKQSLENWQECEKSDWNDDLYTNTKTIMGNPIAAATQVKVVIVEPNDKGMEKSIQRLYRDRFPELISVSEDFEVMEQMIKIRSKSPAEAIQRKIVKITHDGTDRDIWEKLSRLKQETENEASIAIHQINTMSLQRLRKMTECVFHGTRTNIEIYSARQTTKDDAKKPRQKERRTYALIVNDSAKEYRTMLKDFKQAMGANPAGSAIIGTRSTKDGKLLIITDKDKKSLDEIESVVKKTSQSVRIIKPGNMHSMETIHIRGMDAITRQEEVVAAIENKIGPLEGKCRVSEMRPNKNNTQAVTVTLGKENAEKLTKDKYIRVGVVSCSIEKRINRCRKCWSYEHQASECDGPDRSKLCYRCGTEGHSVKGCTAEEACPICREVGHKTGRGKCKVFRAALTQVRKGRNARKHGNEENRVRSNEQERTCTLND